MTWATLIARNLVRRPVRTLLTAAGVALGVALIVALLSISAGVRRTAGDLIHVGRADFGLFQSGVSDLTRSLLPETLEKQVAAQRGVAQTAVLFLYVTDIGGQSSSLLFGMKPGEFPAPRLDAGAVLPLPAVQRLARRPGEVTTIAVTVKLGQKPRPVADRIARRFGISAIAEPGQAVKVDTSSRLVIDVGWVISVLALIVGGI